MSEFNWEQFLREFSLELLSSEEIKSEQPGEVIISGWMGYPGASEQDIGTLENTLGVRLPPSYCEFLKVSNGWRNTGFSINKVYSTEEVSWFKEQHQSWIKNFQEAYKDLPRIPDEEYLVYSDDQDTTLLRIEYIETALAISAIGDSAIYLLNPEVKTVGGEWEAWFFANWLPGAVRFPSFSQLMEDERKAFINELSEAG